MSSLQEIESAIRELSEGDRAKLITDLPGLLPELDGDNVWRLIALDPRPHPKLSALIDQVDAERARHPETHAVLRDTDFGQ
ncbi:MAG TPA: hypothetical protein VNT99_05480 [Methylomirabilota bacterium]|nr:hypothetical protein [Methylomirabilota bacterium]